MRRRRSTLRAAADLGPPAHACRSARGSLDIKHPQTSHHVTPTDARRRCDGWTPNSTSPLHGLAAKDRKDDGVLAMSLHLSHV